MIFALGAISFVTWQFLNMQAKVDESTLQSTPQVHVEEVEAYFRFAPVVDTSDVGVIFYPGALVDPVAYGPMAFSLANRGVTTLVLKVPYRIDMMSWQTEAVYDRTHAVLDESEKQWVLGGHSRGGRMALQFVRENPAAGIAGLLLVGTSHPREIDHSFLDIPVVKVYGSLDGLASPEEVEASAVYLPDHTDWVKIEGGNHAQFAWYGTQFGDEKATISREEQQAQLLDAIEAFLGQYSQHAVDTSESASIQF